MTEKTHCECGFRIEDCSTNPCYRKQVHLAGLTPDSEWPNGAPIGWPSGAKIERVDEPPYLSDDLVEQIAVLHNGGTWPDHYKEEHRQHWRGQAIKIIALVKLYLEHPLYKITAPEPTGGRVFGFTVDSITQREGGHVDLDRLDRGQTGKIDIVDSGRAT